MRGRQPARDVSPHFTGSTFHNDHLQVTHSHDLQAFQRPCFSSPGMAVLTSLCSLRPVSAEVHQLLAPRIWTTLMGSQWSFEASTMLLQWLGMLFHLYCVIWSLSCHLLNSDSCWKLFCFADGSRSTSLHALSWQFSVTWRVWNVCFLLLFFNPR